MHIQCPIAQIRLIHPADTSMPNREPGAVCRVSQIWALGENRVCVCDSGFVNCTFVCASGVCVCVCVCEQSCVCQIQAAEWDAARSALRRGQGGTGVSSSPGH